VNPWTPEDVARVALALWTLAWLAIISMALVFTLVQLFVH